MSLHNTCKFAQSRQSGRAHPTGPGKHDKWKYQEAAGDLIYRQQILYLMVHHNRNEPPLKKHVPASVRPAPITSISRRRKVDNAFIKHSCTLIPLG